MTTPEPTEAPEIDAVLKRTDLLRYGCHGIVTRDGEQDACGKPVTVIIDGRDTEAETYWPACTYHGNRYGGGRIVPLAEILSPRPMAYRWTTSDGRVFVIDPREVEIVIRPGVTS